MDSTKSRLFNHASRILVGFLIFKAFNYFQSAESASLDQQQQQNSSAICSLENVQQFASNQSKLGANSDTKQAWDWYNKCNYEFVSNNSLSPKVKASVDEWLGLDLTKASANQLFWAYQLALAQPKPQIQDPEMSRDCEKMTQSYDSYRDITMHLAPYIQIDPNNWMDGDEDDESSGKTKTIGDTERQLLNFVEYSRFCNFMTVI